MRYHHLFLSSYINLSVKGASQYSLLFRMSRLYMESSGSLLAKSRLSKVNDACHQKCLFSPIRLTNLFNLIGSNASHKFAVVPFIKKKKSSNHLKKMKKSPLG